MVVFGGEENNISLNDLSLFDIEKNQWLEVKNELKVNNNISPRSFHCSTVLKNKLYIYGGYQIEFLCLIEILIFDFNNFLPGKYQSIEVTSFNFNNFSSPFPYPRWGCSLVGYGNNLLLFGGRNKIDFNDIWLYDTYKNKWIEIFTPKNETPKGRRKQSMAIDEENKILFVSGGYDGQYLNDIYFMNLKDMSTITQANQEFSQWVNNPKFSDFEMKYKSLTFYCHRPLFFKRIPIEDITQSNIILEIFNGKKEKENGVLNLTCLEDQNDNNLNLNLKIVSLFLEFIYSGRFPHYISIEEFKGIYYICKFLRLRKLIEKYLFNFLKNNLNDFFAEKKYSIHNFVWLNFTEAEKIMNFLNSDFLFYQFPNEIILPNNGNSIDITPFLSFQLYMFSFDINNNDTLNTIPKNIFKNLKDFIDNDYLPEIENSDITELLDLLFYSDFLSINFLFSKIEEVLFEYIDIKNACVLLPIAYFCNSQILVYKILEILKEENINVDVLIPSYEKLIGHKKTNELISFIQQKIKDRESFYSINEINNNIKMKIRGFTKGVVFLDRLSEKLRFQIFCAFYNSNTLINLANTNDVSNVPTPLNNYSNNFKN
jgi:hypothetical protein